MSKQDKQIINSIKMMILILQLKQADFKNKMKEHFNQANEKIR